MGPAETLAESEGGGQGKISDPILFFWSKLGTCVREGFIYIPLTPQEILGGRGVRSVSEVNFRIFLGNFCLLRLALFVTAMALHTM